MEKIMIPYQHIDKCPVPCPMSVIQLALSDYRNSDMTDRELASYISECLYHILSRTSTVIEPVQDDMFLLFKKRNEEQR